MPSRRTMTIGAAVTIVALIGAAAFWFVGNPINVFRSGEVPAAPKNPAPQLPLSLAALPAPAAMPEPTPVPQPLSGSFSILIGTYDNVKDARDAEATLRDQKLSPYTIDLLMAPDDMQRRILLGRFATREDAEAAREKLDPQFTTARIIRGSQERVPLLIP